MRCSLVCRSAHLGSRWPRAAVLAETGQAPASDLSAATKAVAAWPLSPAVVSSRLKANLPSLLGTAVAYGLL